MISRTLVLLTLMSSCFMISAQEVQPKERKTAKKFAHMALTASIAATCLGLYNGNTELVGCGLGLSTGLGLAAYEAKSKRYPILPWIPEFLARLSITTELFYNVQLPKDKPQSTFTSVFGGSCLGSWLGYLGYHVANYIDKE